MLSKDEFELQEESMIKMSNSIENCFIEVDSNFCQVKRFNCIKNTLVKRNRKVCLNSTGRHCFKVVRISIDISRQLNVRGVGNNLASKPGVVYADLVNVLEVLEG